MSWSRGWGKRCKIDFENHDVNYKEEKNKEIPFLRLKVPGVFGKRLFDWGGVEEGRLTRVPNKIG